MDSAVEGTAESDHGGVGSAAVLIVDGAELFRLGAASVVHSVTGLEVVAAADGIESTRRYALGHRPDLALFGPNRLNHSGAESISDLIGCINEVSPGTRTVVVLGADPDLDEVRDGVEGGADGIISVAASWQEFLEAMKRVLSGDGYLAPRLGLKLIRAREPQQDGSLSPREREVVEAIALGYTNSEIAVQLHLSVRTVESHRANIQSKLGLSRRFELVRYALDNGLLS